MKRIYVRIGEEFNGNWMPWASKGKEALFAEAYRQFVGSFRSVSPRFRFEWNVNVGDYGTNPAQYGNSGILLNSEALKNWLFGPLDGPPRNTAQIGMPG